MNKGSKGNKRKESTYWSNKNNKEADTRIRAKTTKSKTLQMMALHLIDYWKPKLQFMVQ